jgi:hypothetical protein
VKEIVLEGQGVHIRLRKREKKDSFYYYEKIVPIHLYGCVWHRRETVKREIDKREYEMREIYEK